MTSSPAPEGTAPEGSESPLRARLARADGMVTVYFSGDIDVTTHQRLTQEVLSAVDSSVHSVVIDIARVSFIDSSGIHALLTAQHVLEHRNIGLRVSNPAPWTLRVLRIAGVDTLLGIAADDATEDA